MGAILAAAPAIGDPATPRFVDATGAAGLEHVYGGDPDYVVGGGVAALDCDADGRTDLFLSGGAHPAQLYRNDSEPGAPIALKRARKLGVAAEKLLSVTGAYPFDFDGDGALDLFLLRFGRNLLLRGLGDCRFEDISDAVGLPAHHDWSTAFAAIWRSGERLPTLAVGNYVDRSRPLQRRGNCGENYLLRPPSPDAESYGAPTPLEPGACPLSYLFVDWSGDGTLDLRAANDRQYYDFGMSEQMFRLSDDGVRPLGPNDGWKGPVIWGMGLAAADLDRDGRPEIAVTNMADNRLESLSATAGGAPAFENRAYELGAMSQRPYVGGDPRPSTSWHVDFADLNNDGLLDLWIVKGNVDSMPEFAAFDPDSLLIQQPGGGFVERGFEAGVAVDGRGRGGAATDLNGDGQLDLVVVNRDQPARIFQAVDASASGGWVEVALAQQPPNRMAVGATVEVETEAGVQRRTCVVGGGHAGGVAGPLHFGLGEAQGGRLRVTWPDGASSDWRDFAAGERVMVDRQTPRGG